MKKTLLFLAAAASFGTASAQKAGDIFVYGSIGYMDNRDKTNTSGVSTETHGREFTFTPGIGYQFNTNWGAGLTGDMVATKVTTPASTGTGTNEVKESLTYAGPFVRYTRNLSNLFFVFGQFNAMYVRSNYNTSTNGASGNALEGNGVAGRLFPALGINVSRSLSVIGSFGAIEYLHLTRDQSGINTDYKTDNLNATFGRNFTLGVQWNFSTGMHRSRMEPMDETRRMDTSDDNGGEDMPRRRRD